MRTTLRLENPNDVDVILTISAPVKEFQALSDALKEVPNASYEMSELRRALSKVTYDMRREFSVRLTLEPESR